MVRPKLLVMDDEAMFCEFVEEVALDLGCEVRLLTNSGKFTEAFKEFMPDIIILDMVMPEFDGTEITRWLASEKYTGKLVMVSGYNPQFSKIAKLLGELGGLNKVERLSKPVRLEELRRILKD